MVLRSAGVRKLFSMMNMVRFPTLNKAFFHGNREDILGICLLTSPAWKVMFFVIKGKNLFITQIYDLASSWWYILSGYLSVTAPIPTLKIMKTHAKRNGLSKYSESPNVLSSFNLNVTEKRVTGSEIYLNALTTHTIRILKLEVMCVTFTYVIIGALYISSYPLGTLSIDLHLASVFCENGNRLILLFVSERMLGRPVNMPLAYVIALGTVILQRALFSESVYIMFSVKMGNQTNDF